MIPNFSLGTVSISWDVLEDLWSKEEREKPELPFFGGGFEEAGFDIVEGRGFITGFESCFMTGFVLSTTFFSYKRPTKTSSPPPSKT